MNYSATNKRPAFIMMVVLILMLFFATVAQRFSKQLLLTSALANGYANQERARMLAYSGLSYCLQELFRAEMLLQQDAQTDKPTNAQEGQASQSRETQQLQSFFRALLTKLNLWQEIKLTSEVDGCRGTIKVCLMCEDGKININNIVDAEKKQLKSEYLVLLDRIESHQTDGQVLKLSQILHDFFAKRQWKLLEDPSELDLGIWFRKFYLPPEPPPVADDTADKIKLEAIAAQQAVAAATSKIALTDLFTTFGATQGINLLLLTSGMCRVLGYGTPTYLADDVKATYLQQLQPKITSTLATQWPQNFKDIDHWLSQNNPHPKTNNGSEAQKISLEKIQSLLSNEIEPKFLSVLCYGEFKKNKQTMLAIVERQPLQARTTLSWSERQNRLVPPGYNVVRIYFGIDAV